MEHHLPTPGNVQGAELPLEMTAGHFVPITVASGSRAGTHMSRAGAVHAGHRVLLPDNGAFALRTVTKVSPTADAHHLCGCYPANSHCFESSHPDACCTHQPERFVLCYPTRCGILAHKVHSYVICSISAPG
jgi:hypothetical protein